jgi:hypothetical protein
MIKIEINAENGADARKELIDLLGLSTQTTWIGVDPAVPGKDFSVKTTIEAGGVTNVERIEETAEQPAAEEKKKRRTKAEIEAEKAALAANTGSEEPPASAETTSAPVEEKAAEPSHPDLPALQRICAIMVRAGYKADAVKIIETVGKAPSSADVLAENRQAVIDALTELAKQQNVAL